MFFRDPLTAQPMNQTSVHYYDFAMFTAFHLQQILQQLNC